MSGEGVGRCLYHKIIRSFSNVWATLFHDYFVLSVPGLIFTHIFSILTQLLMLLQHQTHILCGEKPTSNGDFEATYCDIYI